MPSTRYVWEKMLVAISCLCKEGTFKERLENATVSSLMRLERNDLTGELQEDLKYVLDWTKNNMTNGVLQREPDELEKNRLIEKILCLFSETARSDH